MSPNESKQSAKLIVIWYESGPFDAPGPDTS